LFNHNERIGNFPDTLEAITLIQRSVQLTPSAHADMSGRLNGLGNVFLRRFEHTGDVSDVSRAISAHQQAVQLIPSGHPGVSGYLNNLGSSFQHRFKCSRDPADIHTAISTFRRSAMTFGPLSTRLEAAQEWAKLSMTHFLPQSLTAYAIVIDLISQIAGMDRTIQQRHTHLIEISSLTTCAASAAFTLGEVEKALEWLEQGRCLVWSQLNQLRTSLDHLRAHNEHLAQRFSDISRALEASGSRGGLEGIGTDSSPSQKIILQNEAHLHLKLSREWAELLENIRSIPQFHDFLRPLQASCLLQNLPPHGAVILINVHESRCDALALISGFDAPIHIPLDEFTHKEASELSEHLRHSLSSHRVGMRDADRGLLIVLDESAEKRTEIHFVLEALWLRVVRPILDGLAFSVSLFHFMTYYFVNIVVQVYSPVRSSSNLVVSN